MSSMPAVHNGLRLLALTALISARPASGAPQLEKQVEQHGDFVLIGNTLGWDCTTLAPLPAPVVVGQVGACGTIGLDDTAPDIFWRADDAAATADVALVPSQARTTAVLQLPDGATITYARLYWAGMEPDQLDVTETGTTTLLERPGAAFSQRIAADRTWSKPKPGDSNTWWFQSAADVTSLVKQLGPGALRVGDFQRQDGSSAIVDLGLNPATGQRTGLDSFNPFAAWSLVVFYELAGDPMRNLALFEGFDIVVGGTTADISVTGFFIPETGFRAKLGVVAYEGDATIPGDSLVFNGTGVSDPQNPSDNFFNGTRSYLGTPVSTQGDLPQLTGTAGSMSGVDIDVVDVTPFVKAGDFSATVQATTLSGDQPHDDYVVGVLVTSISTLRPNFSGITMTVRNLTRSDGTYAGDVLEYTIVVANGGNDTSVGTVLTDTLPAGVELVAGSISVDSAPRTEAVDGDVVDFAAGQLTARLGAGATSSAGGSLAPGASSTVVFRVTVTKQASGTVLDNQAAVAAGGLLGDPQQIWQSHPPDGTGPSSVPIDACATDADCSPAAPVCRTASSPHVCVAAQQSEPLGTSSASKASGCGCSSAADGAGTGILAIVIALAFSRRRRRAA